METCWGHSCWAETIHISKWCPHSIWWKNTCNGGSNWVKRAWIMDFDKCEYTSSFWPPQHVLVQRSETWNLQRRCGMLLKMMLLPRAHFTYWMQRISLWAWSSVTMIILKPISLNWNNIFSSCLSVMTISLKWDPPYLICATTSPSCHHYWNHTNPLFRWSLQPNEPMLC